MSATVRLTLTQALVRYLCAQYTERDGQRQRAIPAIVGIFGYCKIDLSAKILAVLVITEYVAVLILDAAIISAGGDSMSLSVPTSAFTSGDSGISLSVRAKTPPPGPIRALL